MHACAFEMHGNPSPTPPPSPRHPAFRSAQRRRSDGCSLVRYDDDRARHKSYRRRTIILLSVPVCRAAPAYAIDGATRGDLTPIDLQVCVDSSVASSRRRRRQNRQSSKFIQFVRLRRTSTAKQLASENRAYVTGGQSVYGCRLV